MSRHAANSAAQPNSSLNAPRVLISSFGRDNEHCSIPSSGEALTRRKWAAIRTNVSRREATADFGALRVLPPRIPSSTRDHASGPIRRPAARRSSASASPPSGLRFPSTTDPPQMQSLALGSRAHSPGFAGVTRAGYGKFNETENTIMYQNKVTLIGFLGNDAEVRSNDNRSLNDSFTGNQELLQEGWQVHRAHRMASLRRLRQARRVRQHAQERRSYPGRGRVAQPEV